MTDLKHPALFWLKFGLLLLAAVLAGTLLLLQCPSWPNAALLAVTVWGSCRAYYFAFYVIEHWLDPGYRYAGLVDFVRRWRRHRR